jgi:hypothetical protein
MLDYCCERFGLDQTTVCDMHPDRKGCPDAMILPLRGGYGLPVRNGRAGYAQSVTEIRFCSFCGAGLPPIGDLED